MKVLLCCGKAMVRGSGYCSECGTEYNSAGRKLTPRSQWGEETGEHFY